jgi:NodT family efflux transporter outer membrane factor (OMF) lipoprotein
MTRKITHPALAAALLALQGCSMAPAYHVPASAPAPAQFKAATGWQTAQPADAVAKGAWWQLFDDPVLNRLETQLSVSNQNVAYYRAAYAQAQALVRADKAALLPSVGVSGSTSRSQSMADGAAAAKSFAASASASWVPDLWGSLANTAAQAGAQAQASAANLANATLSAQATLASNYLQLRAIDAQAAMLDETITGYARALQITRNKQAAGTVSQADVETASTTLTNAQATRRDLTRQRNALENAIGVLVGENPSSFHLAPAQAWSPVVPPVPSVLPAQILQRRPDVASAERAVAAANAAIGIQRAAFFPSVSLTASLGSTTTSASQLFSAATSLWSLGASTAVTLLDFGARSAKVRQARAAYDAAAATYRQTALTAFQEVETDLAAIDAYAVEAEAYARSAQSAGRAEAIARNQYLAGTVDYTTVTSAQATAYTARVNTITATLNRQNAAISLIQAIGGHWDAASNANTTAKASLAAEPKP